MKTNFIPNYIFWKVDLSKKQKAEENFSKNTAKKIQKAEENFKKSPYDLKIKPVTPNLLDQFMPLYRKNISQKQGARIMEVKQEILKRQKKKRYEAVTLHKDQKFLGALIFSYPRKDEISTAYKVFPYQLDDLKLPISPTYLAEYFFYDYAIKNKIKLIKHGKDKNLYGINSNPGLALFKLSIGCNPYVSKARDNQFIDFNFPSNNPRDILCFFGKKRGEKIKKASLKLYNSKLEDLKSKYGPLFKSQLEIQTI
jgi:hypothetical protein